MAYDNIEDFTVDFTLRKDEQYGTRLDVEENFTMIFPETNSQHGPIRELFWTNQSGKNLIVEKGGKIDLEVLMDGEPFPIAQTEAGGYATDKSIVYYIGRASSYLHGEHKFTLKYHYVNVMINSATEQDFYWNANGTGWEQTFSKVTANLHIADPEALAAVMASQTSCYVGKYKTMNSGTNISNRCEMAKTTDGYTFETTDLNYGEGLTFAVDFEPNTYGAPTPQDDYTLLLVGGVILAGLVALIAWMIRSCNKKIAAKKKLYKDTFVKPEYAPTRGLTVAEGEQLLMKGAKKSYVATLLELAVAKKVQIVKGEPTKVLKKDTWKVKVLTTEGLTKPQENMLKLLAGSHEVKEGEIEIKRRTATSYMASVASNYRTKAMEMLQGKGLTESKTRGTDMGAGILIAAVLFMTFGLWTVMAPWILLSIWMENAFVNVIGAEWMPWAVSIMVVIAWLVGTVCAIEKGRYGWYTEEGLRAERDLEGLRLYVGMAEAERLKFLQSVKGADTSSEGIVKLYEKTLPWAALFGQEESWLKELGKYYQTVGEPEWCGSPDLLDFAVFHAVTSSITSSVVSTSSYSSGSSGSGGGSSFGGGGGGGGFSGGGGGGGGGGRW